MSISNGCGFCGIPYNSFCSLDEEFKSNCPCRNCIVKIICSNKCSSRYDYRILEEKKE